MSATSAIFGERYLSKVGAIFSGGAEARQGAAEITRLAGISASQVKVVEPRDPSISRKLEPESQGIARTMVRSHVTLGLAGLVIGLLIAAVMMFSGIDAITWSPFFVFTLFGGLGAILGMLSAGFLTLRPDHDVLISQVEEAARHGRWAVVVHARNHEEEERAKRVLEGMTDRVVETF